MLETLTGNFFAIFGAAIAFIFAGFGSSKGVGLAGEAGAGVLTEDPGKFGPVMVLQALPSTQAIYAFVIAFLTIQKVVVGDSLSIAEGFILFAGCIPIGFVGWVSGIFQGRVAAAGINMIAKRPEGLGRAIVMALMVEMFAILGFIVSILMIGKVA